MGRSLGRKSPDSLSDALAWLAAAPEGTSLSAAAVYGLLQPLAAGISAPVSTPPTPPAETWRERLWTVPVDTRLGVREVAEAIGRPKSWVYRRTSAASGKALLPFRRLDGELVFTAGELRAWLKRHEIPGASVVTAIGSVA
jgi:hypothetical protein